MQLHMLTTIDNPHSPVTDWDKWLAWDEQQGHNSTAYLARVTRTNDELSDADQNVARELAIDEIIREDPLAIYIKVPVKNN